MKLLIDTVNSDLYVALIQDNKTTVFSHLKAYKRKSDILPVVFKKIIDEANIKAKDIKDIYVVNGPGSFMGVRAGLTFAKTMASITNANLYEIDNISFISQGKKGEYFVDAKGGKSYKGSYNKVSKIELVPFQENSVINYRNLFLNPEDVLKLFKKVEDPIGLEALYIKDPTVGGK